MNSSFEKNEMNPLTDLSELRIDLSPNGDDLDLICQIRFATTEVDFSNRTYRVGINQARLQLYLDGWEKKLGQDYGDTKLPTVERSSEVVLDSAVGGKLNVAIDSTGSAQGDLAGNAGTGVKRVDTSRSTTSIQPITPLPNGAWKIEAPDVDNAKKPLEGTALAGEQLCVLEKKEGSNRSRVSAELQVRKSKFCVEPIKGNKLGKVFSILRNKDAIVAKVLEKAITREAERTTNRSSVATIVASKVEFEEL